MIANHALFVVLLGALAWACDSKEPAHTNAPSAPSAAIPSIHTLKAKRLDGADASLGDWKGKVVLIVNTASECGFTPQYEGLQALHEKYQARGFAVLGFPSNDFGGQEPGTSTEIATFCKSKYGVSFPMFEKVATKGAGRAELYTVLTSALGEPKWNFHKYLVDKQGVPVKAFPSGVKPDSPDLARAIDEQLAR